MKSIAPCNALWARGATDRMTLLHSVQRCHKNEGEKNQRCVLCIDSSSFDVDQKQIFFKSAFWKTFEKWASYGLFSMLVLHCLVSNQPPAGRGLALALALRFVTLISNLQMPQSFRMGGTSCLDLMTFKFDCCSNLKSRPYIYEFTVEQSTMTSQQISCSLRLRGCHPVCR